MSSVSIHAPHAGRDRSSMSRRLRVRCFNPRAPCGARPVNIEARVRGQPFQSTRPMRGATPAHLMYDLHFEFQSTRPMRGATRHLQAKSRGHLFQSTRPMRGATLARRKGGITKKFQSTRPMRGATLPCACTASPLPVSIHAPHAGRDRGGSRCCAPTPSFNPRAPCGARRAKVLLFAVM